MGPHEKTWRDRRHAGEELGAAVRSTLGDLPDALVLGLPRGGVVVAAPVAAALGAQLDVLVVRKVGVPWHPELALGAVTAAGHRVYNDDVLARAQLSRAETEDAYQEAIAVARERESRLRGRRPPPQVGDRTVIVVDDGIATGATARVAVDVLRSARPAPARVVAAFPVGPPDVIGMLDQLVDDIIVLTMPPGFVAVGEWYDDFGQIDDDEVRRLLSE